MEINEFSTRADIQSETVFSTSTAIAHIQYELWKENLKLLNRSEAIMFR